MAEQPISIIGVGLSSLRWRQPNEEKSPLNKRRGAQREKQPPREEPQGQKADEGDQHLDLRA